VEIVLTHSKQGTYDSSYEAGEPDAHIVDLNTELVQCNEAMAVNLPKKRRRYDKLVIFFIEIYSILTGTCLRASTISWSIC